MFKKLLFIGTLCMGIILLLQTDGMAAKNRVIVGSLFDNSSLEGYIYVEGPGNYDRWPGQLTLTVWPTYVSFLCENPTKKKWPNRMGTPYFWEGEVSGTQVDDDWDVDKNGAVTVYFYFTDSQLFGGPLTTCPEDACDTNPKWQCVQDPDTGEYLGLLVEFNARILLESNPDGTGYITDHDIGLHCTLDDDLIHYTCVDDCADSSVCFNYDFDWDGNLVNP